MEQPTRKNDPNQGVFDKYESVLLSIAIMNTQRVILIGVGYTVAAYFFFTVNDAIVKWLVTSIPVVQILFLRSLVAILVCWRVTGKKLATKAINSPIRGQLLLRGVLVLIAWFCYYAAAPYLALGEMVTLYFAAPIFVAAIAGKLLGEQIPRLRWAAIAIGFIGVVAASRLDCLPRLLASLAVLLAALLWAINTVLSRKVVKVETSSVQICMMNIVLFIVCGIALFWQATPMTVEQWLLIVLVGGMNTSAQFMLQQGIQRLAASVVAPLEFSALIWSFILGYVIWGDKPIGIVVVGALLITLSGVLIVLEQWRAHRLYPSE